MVEGAWSVHISNLYFLILIHSDTFSVYICLAYNLTYIPLKPYFKGFCLGISNILHGVYLKYFPNNRVLIHLKGLTVNICIKP